MGNSLAKNKTGVYVGIAAFLIGTGLWFYKRKDKNGKKDSSQVENQIIPEQKANQIIPEQKANQALTIQEQIQKFKSQIDPQNPTLQNVKQLFAILTRYVKAGTVEATNKFKQERRVRFPKGKRLQNLSEYFKYTSEGLSRLQKRIMQLQVEQTELITQIGFNQALLAQYSMQISQYLQELIFGNDFPIQVLRKSITIKTEYIQQNGAKIIDELIGLSAELTLQEKQQVPLVLNAIISDQVYQDEPQLDNQEFDIAYQKYRSQITFQLIRLEKVFMPLIGKLQTFFIGQQDGQNNIFGGSNGFGQLGNMGELNEQMMIQQIEQLRHSDPQAYEQLMLMMQTQMER